ncbi:MAG: Polyribonucleotide 5'-hydroxyl-kinase [Promethearchaeota archaeon]|nr:MAG: Polyribonucleotide 5'-hydroxyl-kinase [Candidatus Lokiarchaeota archaeon]
MINKELKEGHTLLVKGPTRVNIVKGTIEIFGKTISGDQSESITDLDKLEEENVLIVPDAKQYPLYGTEDVELEIYTNNPDENLEEIEENSIPEEWRDIKDSILNQIKKKKEGEYLKIMVLGLSRGKTTLIKYLANKLLHAGYKGGYLDSDLGQQIMYLPTTISIGEIEKSIISGEDISPDYTTFIGATFPKGNLKFIVSHACRNMINNYIEKFEDTDFILIDTDGWIKTEAGVIYKKFFIETVKPDTIVIFHDKEIDELKEIEKDAKKKSKLHLIEKENEFYYEKSKDERRFLRQSQFSKVLQDYRKITIDLDDIEFLKYQFNKEENRIEEEVLNTEELIKLPYHYVLIALLDENSKIIKIGLLFSINIEKDYILLFSDLSYKEQLKIDKVLVGSLRLSTKGNHQGYLYL